MFFRNKKCVAFRSTNFRETQASWRSGLKRASTTGKKIWIKSVSVRPNNLSLI